MSGNTKLTGTTNLLLRAALEALQPLPTQTEGSLSTPVTPPRTPPSSVPSISSLSLSQILPPRRQSGSPAPGSRDTSPPSASPSRNSISSLRASDDAPPLFNATVDQIRDNHLEAARASVKDARILKPLEEDLIHDCERLRSFLLAAQVRVYLSLRVRTHSHFSLNQILDEISPRSKDAIIGVGERLSCRIVTAVLLDRVRFSKNSFLSLSVVLIILPTKGYRRRTCHPRSYRREERRGRNGCSGPCRVSGPAILR
jgi:aspartate kinase